MKNVPVVNNVFLDVVGVQDAVLITVHGTDGSYSYAIDVTEDVKKAGARHFLPDVLKVALARFYDTMAKYVTPGIP